MEKSSKYCPRCKTTLDLLLFHKNKARKDGVQSLCKACFKVTQRKYIDNNRDKVLSGLRRYRKDNFDYFKNYSAINRHKKAAKQNAREARKRLAMPKWLSEEHLSQITDMYWLARDLKLVSGQDYHVDHIVPLKGKNVCGLHVPWNLQILPADLNISKSNKLTSPEEGQVKSPM